MSAAHPPPGLRKARRLPGTFRQPLHSPSKRATKQVDALHLSSLPMNWKFARASATPVSA
ncbi:MAG: hypothetical protein BGP25_08755 [Lysobacterales bacterium 63-13]|nr:MAG: hypothetical protein BGP25_08755 [Xanthomonadales bacterium 63-13]